MDWSEITIVPGFILCLGPGHERHSPCSLKLVNRALGLLLMLRCTTLWEVNAGRVTEACFDLFGTIWFEGVGVLGSLLCMELLVDMSLLYLFWLSWVGKVGLGGAGAIEVWVWGMSLRLDLPLLLAGMSLYLGYILYW